MATLTNITLALQTLDQVEKPCMLKGSVLQVAFYMPDSDCKDNYYTIPLDAKDTKDYIIPLLRHIKLKKTKHEIL